LIILCTKNKLYVFCDT